MEGKWDIKNKDKIDLREKSASSKGGGDSVCGGRAPDRLFTLKQQPSGDVVFQIAR